MEANQNMKQEIYFSKTSKSAGLADFGQIKKTGHSNVTGSPKWYTIRDSNPRHPD